MDSKNVDIEEKALDIILSDDLTQQQLDELKSSPELQDCVQDALDLRTVVQRQAEPVNVEARLEAFKEARSHRDTRLSRDSRLSREPRNSRKARVIFISLAVAAAFLGFIFCINHFLPRQPEKSPYFYTATTQTGISLKTENGDEATLSPKSKQNTSISIDDFRKMFSDASQIKEVTLSIPVGKSADFTLPDSSKVYLAPGSKLTFPLAFTSDKRVVKLEGMAYFKVTHNAAKPFIVITDKTETTVLGTEFMVDSKSGDVSLVTGRVRVQTTSTLKAEDQRPKTITLKPEQMVHFSKNGDPEISDIDTTPLTAWRDGYLYFDNVELKDIMLAIGANFNKNIDFRSHKAEHYKMRFITERNQGVQAAIEMMNRMEKVKVSLVDNTIVVDDIN